MVPGQETVNGKSSENVEFQRSFSMHLCMALGYETAVHRLAATDWGGGAFLLPPVVLQYEADRRLVLSPK